MRRAPQPPARRPRRRADSARAWLARPRRGITLGEIIRAVSQEAAPPAEGESNPLFTLVVQPFWMDINEMTLKHLDTISLDMLARRAAGAGLASAPSDVISFVI